MHLITDYMKYRKTVAQLLAAVLLHLTPCAHASYLADLEAEAKSTTVPAEESNDASWSHKTQGLSESLKSGLSEEAFAQSLRDNYYGSFLFYDKLSEWDKKKVYQTYQESNDIEQIRNEIKVRMTK